MSTDTTALSDRVVSYLRTIVPIWWGALVTWLLGQVPVLSTWLDSLGIDPTSATVVTAVSGVVTAAWYVVWRWVEPRLPDWLTRIVLGSARPPAYSLTAAVDDSPRHEA